MAPVPPVPLGTRIRVRPEVKFTDGARVLRGGSPVRMIRLARAAPGLAPGAPFTVTSASSAVLARRLLEGNLADPVLDAGSTLAPGVCTDLLTVVVPVRDRAAHLDRCLAALQGMSVIVVDDASMHPDKVAAVALHHGAEVIALASNGGPASARNAGLARVRTPLVAFVDSDVEADAGMLTSLARHCADPQVALVGPRVEGRTRSPAPSWWERYDVACSSLSLGHRPCSVRPGAAVAWLPSACLIGRTAVLRAAGGFAAGERVGEDVDLVWRLVAAGHGVRYDPDHVAWHEVRGTIRGWLGRKAVYGSGGAMLAQRHGEAVAPAVFSPAMAAAAFAVLQRRWWSMPIAVAATAWSARAVYLALPAGEARTRTAVALSAQGFGWALRQASALAVRHWWPPVVLGCFVSARFRRALVSALVIDTVVQIAVLKPPIDPLTGWVGRRCDDAAYGAGLWWGALRARSLRCVRPRFTQATRG